jgi:hypothetical protein
MRDTDYFVVSNGGSSNGLNSFLSSSHINSENSITIGGRNMGGSTAIGVKMRWEVKGYAA